MGDGSACSAIMGVSYSVDVGLIVCSIVYSMVYCSGLAVCSVVCSIIDYSSCSSLGSDCAGYVGMAVVWADEEENLLKIFVLRP